MANNYFLTGDKGIGKSTIINHYIDMCGLKVGGFKTLRFYNEDGRVSYHIIDVSKNEPPNKDNFLFYKGKRPNDVYKRFDELSIVLDGYKNFDLILMDELGPTEENAEIFKNKVIKVLDSDIIVVGVIQDAKSNFLDTIMNRKDVKIYRIDLNNRNEFKFNISK